MHIGFLCLHGLGQSVFPHPVLLLKNFLCIQNRCPVIFAAVQLPIDFHGIPGILRLHHQQELIVAHVALHCVAPAFFLNIDKIRQDFHTHRLAEALHQSLIQELPGLRDLPGIDLAARVELRKLSLDLLHLSPQAAYLSVQFGLLLLHLIHQLGDVSLQFSKLILLNLMGGKPLDIPENGIAGHIVVIPRL